MHGVGCIRSIYLPKTNIRLTISTNKVLIIYDYLLTFSLEQEQIWRPKINLAKLLFALTRYGNLVYLGVNFYINFYDFANDAVSL